MLVIEDFLEVVPKVLCPVAVGTHHENRMTQGFRGLSDREGGHRPRETTQLQVCRFPLESCSELLEGI
ncbi:MAG: hypothetical protein CME19_05370 [Gemmatimonadetes bacterium]|nr:hypothetical protein [Gemmatimonadota bacterium]